MNYPDRFEEMIRKRVNEYAIKSYAYNEDQVCVLVKQLIESGDISAHVYHDGNVDFSYEPYRHLKRTQRERAVLEYNERILKQLIVDIWEHSDWHDDLTDELIDRYWRQLYNQPFNEYREQFERKKDASN